MPLMVSAPDPTMLVASSVSVAEAVPILEIETTRVRKRKPDDMKTFLSLFIVV